MHYHWGQTAAEKRNVVTLNSAHKIKSNVTLPVVGKNDSNAVYIACSESCETKRFVRCWNKVEESIFKNNNEINSTVTTKSWVLSKDWTRTCPNTGMVSKWKWWSSFGLMVDVVLQVCEYCIILTKTKAISLSLFVLTKTRNDLKPPETSWNHPETAWNHLKPAIL